MPTRPPIPSHTTSKRCQHWQGLSATDILNSMPVGQTQPLIVLNTLIRLFNKQHIAKEKEVSFKTRQERARFLRRFFQDLKTEAGFKTLPDPRNLRQRHIQAMVKIWQKRRLASGTLQTYLSYLRALALWVRKPGLVLKPERYGLSPSEYQRQQVAQHDHSWSAKGIDAASMIEKICEYDPYIGAALRLIHAFGLRRKEAVMFSPGNVVPFAETGLPLEKKEAYLYLAVERGSKGGRMRYIPLNTPQRMAAREYARGLVRSNGDLAPPGMNLKQALDRFSYVMKRFGLTAKGLGATAHGLRHQVFLEEFEVKAGHPAPVRGGSFARTEGDQKARLAVAELAGHSRLRASGAYLGGVIQRKMKAPSGTD